MTAKKNSINISLAAILICMVGIAACWKGRSCGFTGLLYAMFTGVFGSGFAALLIFVYEYRSEKSRLLSEIFQEAVSISECAGLPFMRRRGLYDHGAEKSLDGKYYVEPMPADKVEHMDQDRRRLYELSRFVDAFLDIKYERITALMNRIEEIDFWSDSFRRKSKRKDAIRTQISMPIYDTFVSAPAMEDGYLFRYFTGFQRFYEYSAAEIYEFVCNVDSAVHDGGLRESFPWGSTLDLRGYLHERLWIFRDAFYSTSVGAKQKRQAMKAFMGNEPYPYIR